MAGGGELSGRAIAALVLAIVAWMGFAVAFFVASDPFFFLFIALVAGVTAIVLAARARRDETLAVAAGATAAGAALLYGLTLAALLTAMIYATGFLLFLLLLIFLGVMSTPASSSGSGCGCGGGSSSGGGSGSCCEGCCEGCCDGCCDAGACDCGCGDCGCGDCGCGGCGGCGCIAFGLVAAPVAVRRRRSWTDELRHLWRHGLAHHPRTAAYDADVYRIGDARWCIGCFTTYPVFLLASAILVALTPLWASALGIGGALALAQAISSAGLARSRAAKIVVKAALGLGLALLVSGIHSAPWPPAAKLACYAALLALAWASTIPRARRMKRALQGAAGDAATSGPR